MHLKKLEIQGFKSFANKTDLLFQTGVTAIVGPNGSGKSNISDAIRWVLGEQSAKLLRGKKSDDVIFAGSDKKAQCSAASVFLSFGLESEEIIIGRKIFRDGTGQYFLNDNRVRLQDITETLASLGISQGDSTVIGQGMSDMILSASPSERRLILEEAAGIKQFRMKRDQSEKKLAATNQNIIRIADLLAEIEPRLASLKRQASKAEKRGEVENKLRELQLKYYSSKLFRLFAEKKNFDAKTDLLKNEIEKERNALENMENALKAESKEESSGQKRIFEIRKELQDLSIKRREAERGVAISDGEIAVLKNAIARARGRIEKIKMDIISEQNKKPAPIQIEEAKYLNIEKEKIRDVLKILDSAISENSIEGIKGHLNKAISFLKNFVQAKDDANNIKREEIKVDISVFENQIGEANKEMEISERSILGLSSEFELQKSELNSVEKEIERLESEMISINQEDQKRRSKFFEVEREIKIKRDQIDKLKERENLIKIDESRISVRLEDIENEAKEELGGEFQNLKNFESADMQPQNLIELEADIRRVKGQLEQIGSIDELVLQECEETEMRFGNLSKEKKDLDEAEANLGNLILKLDEEMAKKFSDSFKEIAKEFEKYFKLVFGGGDAGILYDSQEGGGIEIFAMPPGKKTKNLSMLSGGERALTSIALLFAVIANAHPPFCVLDEVDAALDEANSSRIGKVIKELEGKTQFIVITHNREIMHQANVLYGVTMQKDGVSKLLSVKLE